MKASYIICTNITDWLCCLCHCVFLLSLSNTGPHPLC